MAEHAEFAPSAASRWMVCPGSVKMEQFYEKRSSPEAEEGTAAHELGAACLVEGVNPEEYKGAIFNGFEATGEMVDAVQQYLDYVRGLPGEIANVEQWVNLAHVLGKEEQGGTLDFSTVMLDDGWLHVVDLKYGKGVQVFAQENKQLGLYALGQMGEFNHLTEFRGATLHIVQPRLDHIDTWEAHNDWLSQLMGEAQEAVASAESESPRFQPSEAACQWCPAKADCRYLAEFTSRVMQTEFSDLTDRTVEDPERLDPGQLTAEELAGAMSHVKLIRQWVDAVEKRSLELLKAGQEVPGYKLVGGRNKRTWKDEEAAQKALKNKRYRVDEIAPRVLLSPAQAEKLMGKKNFQEKMGEHVEVTPGPPTLAPVDDNRPALDPADLQGFSDISGQQETAETTNSKTE